MIHEEKGEFPSGYFIIVRGIKSITTRIYRQFAITEESYSIPQLAFNYILLLEPVFISLCMRKGFHFPDDAVSTAAP
jgi:hypothetical protein